MFCCDVGHFVTAVKCEIMRMYYIHMVRRKITQRQKKFQDVSRLRQGTDFAFQFDVFTSKFQKLFFARRPAVL